MSEPSSSSLAAAAFSQLLAIGTGVNHLMCILAHPDRRPIGVGLLGLKRAMHLGTVAAALSLMACLRQWGNRAIQCRYLKLLVCG